MGGSSLCLYCNVSSPFKISVEDSNHHQGFISKWILRSPEKTIIGYKQRQMISDWQLKHEEHYYFSLPVVNCAPSTTPCNSSSNTVARYTVNRSWLTIKSPTSPDKVSVWASSEQRSGLLIKACNARASFSFCLKGQIYTYWDQYLLKELTKTIVLAYYSQAPGENTALLLTIRNFLWISSCPRSFDHRA